jgi:adenine phosphoribosyltransferase
VSDTQTTYRVELPGLVREFPIIEIAPGVRIAFVDCLNDAQLSHTAAQALAPKLAEFQPDVLITPEAKSIPLVYGLAIALDLPYVTLRKSLKAYMLEPVSVNTESITAAGEVQTLYFDARYQHLVAGKRVALIDDVVSTGSTLKAMEQLITQIGGDVVASAAIFTEGDQDQWRDIVALGHLPVFVD